MKTYKTSYVAWLEESAYYACHRALWKAISLTPSIHARRQLLAMCGAKLGPRISFLPGVRVIAPWHLEMVGGSTVNSDCLLDARGGLHIGYNAHIGYSTSVHTMGHHFGDPMFAASKEETRIEDDVIIYPRVFIGPGSHIKRRAVVLPGAVVTGVLEGDAVYGGVPAKLVKRLDPTDEPRPYDQYHPSPFGF